jgi:hypothetical protein
MDQAQALMHVLALASRRAVDSYQILRRALDCRLVRHPEAPDLTSAFSHSDTLAGFMMMAMIEESSDTLDTVGFHFISFEIGEDGRHACLNLERRSMKRLLFIFSVTPEADAAKLSTIDAYNRFDEDFAGSRFIIGAHHLREIGRRVAANEPTEVPAEAAE